MKKLRKVKYKIIIPALGEMDCHWEKEFLHDGYFHEWGVNSAGDGENTVAIVETVGGHVFVLPPDKIKFVNSF